MLQVLTGTFVIVNPDPNKFSWIIFSIKVEARKIT